MSNATQRNFGAAQRERDRRVGLALDGSLPVGSLAVTGDPGWDAFFGSLHDKEESAHAAGMGFRADLGGIGRWAEPSGAGMRVDPNAQNYALGRLAEESGARRMALKQAADANVDSAIADMQGSYDRHVMDSVGQPAIEPTKVTRTIGEGGESFTVRRDPNAPPDTRTEREKFVARLPGSMRIGADAALSPLDQRDRALDIAASKSNEGPLVAVMGPNGQSILVPRQDAVGMRPASSREQGRPVTSGDAGRLTDIKSSLNDLEVLRGAVKDPGTIARIQSWMPTFVSEMTGGWSDEAKQQNAVIARVRQVIGKALEGGVLRKEDEIKYREILPVIGDSKEVATSKINGLQAALNQKMGTSLDSLEDAGFDVSKFRDRGGAGGPGGGGTVKLISPDGKHTRDVPADQVDHYLAQGATRAK